MPRKQKKYHYIYKTTNVVNGKYYIGMHSTDKLNDGYMGSGKRLWNSINYHGKNNHKCEILEYCQNRGELSNREEEIVNEQLLSEDLCMNLVKGGCSVEGGFRDNEHMIKCVKAGGLATSKKMKTDKEFYNKTISNMSNGMKRHHSLGTHNYNTFEGRKHSDETKIKMSQSSKGIGKGEMNSQFGKCWITNEVENKKIMRGDNIPDGWRLGRII